MDYQTQIIMMILYFIALAIAGARIIYLYWMAWKWSQMVMFFQEYRAQHYGEVQMIYLVEACQNIKMKDWMWLRLDYWGPAEWLYDNTQNPRLWFEIVDHWHNHN